MHSVKALNMDLCLQNTCTNCICHLPKWLKFFFLLARLHTHTYTNNQKNNEKNQRCSIENQVNYMASHSVPFQNSSIFFLLHCFIHTRLAWSSCFGVCSCSFHVRDIFLLLFLLVSSLFVCTFFV